MFYFSFENFKHIKRSGLVMNSIGLSIWGVIMYEENEILMSNLEYEWATNNEINVNYFQKISASTWTSYISSNHISFNTLNTILSIIRKRRKNAIFDKSVHSFLEEIKDFVLIFTFMI